MSKEDNICCEDTQGPSSKKSFDSDDEWPTPRRKTPQLKEDKVCRVCGDKALGFNFNIITCESCKAFFRRNAFKEKGNKCLFENNCLVDVRTRRFCPTCRIKKCFAVGMNPQMILDDREKKKRLSKVAENRGKKHLASESESSTSFAADLLQNIKSEPTSEHSSPTPNPIPNPIPNLTPNPTQSDVCTSSDSNSEFPARPKTPIGKPHGDIPEEIFKHPPAHLIPTDPTMFYQLEPDEETCLNNIASAYSNTLGRMPEPGPHSDKKEYQKAADLINNSEIAVRKLIVFVKCLEYFKMLSPTDQISILKSCIMNTLLLRSALFYSIEKDAWITSKCEIPSSILKSATSFVDIHDSHVYYCRRVKSMAQQDINIYAILQVLIIFDPSATNISGRKFVSSIQERYLILLKHYMESRFSYLYSKEYYVSSIDRLCDLKALSEKHSKILLMISPVEVEPLMLEIFNLT